MNELITHKGKVYRPFETELFTGHEVIALPEAVPSLHWKGPKITLLEWWQLVAFLRKFGVEHEAQATLNLNLAEGKWKAWVNPQKWGTGMATNEIADHPHRTEDWAVNFGPGWQKAGTVHTHCKAAAFQSGTDHADEKDITGLHITLGHLDKARLDHHARVSCRGSFFEADLLQWFEAPPEVAALPPPVRPSVMLWYLFEGVPPGQPWPRRWEENLIVEQKTVTGFLTGGSRDFTQDDGATWRARRRQEEKEETQTQTLSKFDEAAFEHDLFGCLDHIQAKPDDVLDDHFNIEPFFETEIKALAIRHNLTFAEARNLAAQLLGAEVVYAQPWSSVP